MVEITEDEWMYLGGHRIMWQRMGQYDALYYCREGMGMTRLKLTVPVKPILRSKTHRYFSLTEQEVIDMVLPRII